MKKIGIIVGRFQVSELHDGHLELIEHVFRESDQVIFILGEARVPLTANNPLPFESRQQMIVKHVIAIENKLQSAKLKWPFLKLNDCKSNEDWSKNLDQLVSDNVQSADQIMLYTGRAGFNVAYSGVFPVTITEQKHGQVSGTEHRAQIAKTVKASKDWREGVIFSTQNKYPTSYQATDTVIIKKETNEILLGRKPAEKKFRMVGGFVDPGDQSLELAAKREVVEECSNIETDNYQYICSYRVKDWRFEGEKDKIMTAFFACNYIFGQPKASDDIAEVKWFKIEDIKDDMLEPEHIMLLKALKKYMVTKLTETLKELQDTINK